jgi:hypothetical protein
MKVIKVLNTMAIKLTDFFFLGPTVPTHFLFQEPLLTRPKPSSIFLMYFFESQLPFYYIWISSPRTFRVSEKSPLPPGEKSPLGPGELLAILLFME